ncbi:ABC transporter permease [Halorussus caseinilyticus]|uniref:ABC transporter permease n=1 Tax=Halorussus caseinilyticus TaxID=3034025 RepID=UPI0023E8D125|nr:ABC transporter permease [Halorussus sp. DT72]
MAYGIPESSSQNSWVVQFQSFLKRHVRASLRNKVALFWNFVWPVLWYLLSVHLIVVPELPDGIPDDVVAAVKGTQVITFGIFGAITVTLVGFAGELTSDIEDKRYRKFRSLPIAPTADLAGRFVSGFTFGLLSFLFVVAVGILDGARFQPRGAIGIPIALLSLLLLCAFCMAIALLVAAFVQDDTQTNILTLSVVMLGFFVTGFNGMQTWMFPSEKYEAVLNFLPNSLAARLQAYYLIDTDWARAGLSPPAMPDSPAFVLPLLAYTVVVGAVAVFVMKRVVYKGDAGD